MTDATAGVHTEQVRGSDATLDNAHVAEDYLARTTTMYRIIAVGRTCSVPRINWNKVGCRSSVTTNIGPVELADGGCGGRRNAHPRPSYGGLQEIVMLTLIEETGPRLIEATGGDPSTGSMLVMADDR
jgi:hypothetical protein